MNFWKRAATVQIGPQRYDMSKFYFKFEVPFEDTGELGTAKIIIHNLSQSTRSSIKRGMPSF